MSRPEQATIPVSFPLRELLRVSLPPEMSQPSLADSSDVLFGEASAAQGQVHWPTRLVLEVDPPGGLVMLRCGNRCLARGELRQRQSVSARGLWRHGFAGGEPYCQVDPEVQAEMSPPRSTARRLIA